MTLNISEGDFSISDPKSLWNGRSLYQLYQEAHTPWEWHKPIFDRCRELGLTAFSTPFDATAVDFLESLGTPCYKVASFENTDIPLIRKIAATGKPMIISSGMASVAELDETIREARNGGCKDIVLLKCTSAYPAKPDSINLLTIPHMMNLFQCQVGLSDHTLGIGVALAAVALGATVIEKHFTLSRADGGVDSAFSMEPQEMSSLVAQSKIVRESLGEIHYGPTEGENKSLIFRRSLYITQDMNAGDILTCENLRAIRPGFGLPTKHYEILLGKRVRKSIKRGTPFSWDLLS